MKHTERELLFTAEQLQQLLGKEQERRKTTTTKRIVWICLFNGIAWVWCSYLLAWLGRGEIAESLSKVALTEIVAVVLVYAMKSLMENLSKHNTWPDKPARQDCDERR